MLSAKSYATFMSALLVGVFAQPVLSGGPVGGNPACWQLDIVGTCGTNADHGSRICCYGQEDETQIPAWTTYAVNIMGCAPAVASGRYDCKNGSVQQLRQNWKCGSGSDSCQAVPDHPPFKQGPTCDSKELAGSTCDGPQQQ